MNINLYSFLDSSTTKQKISNISPNHMFISKLKFNYTKEKKNGHHIQRGLIKKYFNNKQIPCSDSLVCNILIVYHKLTEISKVSFPIYKASAISIVCDIQLFNEQTVIGVISTNITKQLNSSHLLLNGFIEMSFNIQQRAPKLQINANLQDLHRIGQTLKQITN